MYLTHRRCADGLVAELLIDLVDLLAGLLLDDRLGDLAVKGLYVLSELFELLAVRLGQQIDTAGHDLSDLDIGRAEILEGRAQLYGREAVGVVVVSSEDAEHLGAAGLLALAEIGDLFLEQTFQIGAHLFGLAVRIGLDLVKLLLQLILVYLVVLIIRHRRCLLSRFSAAKSR